jgi:sphingomyelin phosphodiesterase
MRSGALITSLAAIVALSAYSASGAAVKEALGLLVSGLGGRRFGTVPALGNATMTCEECEAVVGAVQSGIQSSDAQDIVQGIAELVCLDGNGGFGWTCSNPWACADLCRGITLRFTPEILYIAAQLAFDPVKDCTALGLCNATKSTASGVLGDVEGLSVFPPSPTPQDVADSINFGPTLKVLHISDLHWDPSYYAGARTDCGEPDCCRLVQGLAENASTTCGYWGDHAGDAPTVLVDSMLVRAKALDPDLILLTGDDPPHMVWNITAEDVLEISRNFSAKVQAAFPGKQVMRIYGNHAGDPIDQFRLELGGQGSERLFRPSAEQWEAFGWLDAEARAQFAQGGYYRYRVPGVGSAGKGLVIVAMHPGYHQSGNYYTVLDKTLNVANESAFIQTAVEQAAADGDIVWILTHHPPGDGGYSKVFMDGFLAPLIAQYRDTVRHVFSGHTHKAMLQLLWSNVTAAVATAKHSATVPMEPVVTAYVVAAPTPFSGVNPTFRMYDVNSSSLEVVDYTDYTVDLRAQGLLQQTTAVPAAEWKASYSARAAYNMTALQPGDWYALAERMRVDTNLFHAWELNYHTNNTENADFSPTEQLERVCDIIGGTATLSKLCREGKFNTTLH